MHTQKQMKGKKEGQKKAKQRRQRKRERRGRYEYKESILFFQSFKAPFSDLFN